jgi:hypothetical protein
VNDRTLSRLSRSALQTEKSGAPIKFVQTKFDPITSFQGGFYQERSRKVNFKAIDTYFC